MEQNFKEKALMDFFDFKKDRLYCEEVDVNKIADEVGTPVYIYSARTLQDHYRKLDTAFESIDHLICYSIKTNSNIAVLRLMVREGAGFDIVSSGELYRAVQAGADAGKIVFAGVAKTEDEVREAIKNDILFFSVESIQELERIDRIAGELGKRARFSIRVNPDVDPHTHKNITTGKLENKFGLDVEMTLKAYGQSLDLEHVEAVGLQMHIGSQLVSDEPFIEAIEKVKPLIGKIRKLGIELRYFDIGGGLGVVYNNEKPTTAKQFAEDILPLVSDLGLTLVLEPGRFIAANAGILVTQVQYIKKNPVKRFVIVDAGMNDLMRPLLYDSYHRIISTMSNSENMIKADVVGPICESTDVFAADREIPEVNQGDYLALMTAGAYCASMSSNYNSKPKAAEVLVVDDKYYLIRQRESEAELIKNESIPEFLK